MEYSVFVPERGEYEYYSTTEERPINADLPVPDLPSTVNNIGVPAIEAARPLPFGAKPVGRGWLPRGMIARRSSGLGAFIGGSDGTMFWSLVAAVGIVVAGYYLQAKPKRASR